MKELEIKNIIEKNVLEYARYTITDRAIPNLSDGLKNIHRRIIWSMYNDKLTYDKSRTKSVNAVGSVLRYSPHGDSSVYDACVRLANDSVNHQLIDGKGAFSTKTSRDVTAGASRYTEMRLAPITQELLKDINKNSVPMINNYDDTRLEPTDLPSTFPMILANPNLGIAVGIASNICSFNLSDVIDNTINIINKKETFEMYPDFPTGGNVVRDDEVAIEVKNSGSGSFILQSKYYVEDNSIYITEIPYTTTREAIIESVVALVKSEKVKGILNINDNTGVRGLEIAIDINKNANPEKIMALLLKNTPLQSRFNCNFTVLWEGKPMTLGTDDIIEKWLQFRKKTLRNISSYDLEKKKSSLHILKGLEKILNDIDKTIEIIRETKKDSEVILNIMDEIGVDEKQATSIADLKLRNINKEYVINKTKDIQKIEEDIQYLETLMKDDNELEKLIVDELLRVKQAYKKERKTSIVDFKSIEVDISDKPEDYNLKLFVTRDLYLKKIPLTSMRGKFTNRLKEDDSFTFEEELTNTGEVIVFTNHHNVYKKRLSDINDTRPSDLGEYIPSLFDYEKDEYPLFAVPLKKEFNQTLVLGFDDGTVAKINTSAYYTKQNRQLLKKGYANKNLIYVGYGEGLEHLKAESSTGFKVVREMSSFGTKDGRSSNGNNFMKVDDEIVLEYSVPTEEEIEKYLIKTAGRGKK